LVNDKTTVSTTATAPDSAAVTGPAGPGWKLVACRSNSTLYTTRATGTITTIAVASLLDNETFTIDDGVSPALVFEFNKSGTATIAPANVEVDISGDTTADNVRDTIITAINAVKSLNTIQASNGGAATVDLENVVPGTASNTTQSDTVANVGFVITNMTGGLQADGDGTLAAVTGATNWRDGTLADEDWCVLQSVRRTALDHTQQAHGFLKPTIGATSMVWTINGIALTGVSGARTSGADDFDMSGGTKAAIVTSMVAAINDTANSFKAHVNATAVTAGAVCRVDADYLAHPGLLGNLIDISVVETGASGTAVASSTSSDVANATLGSGLTTNEFELLVRADTSANQLENVLIPMTTENGAFVLSTADANPPPLPSTAFGENLGTAVVTDLPQPGKLVQVADEGSVTGFWDLGDFGSCYHLYLGSVQNRFPSVTKPFVTKGDGDDDVHWNTQTSSGTSVARVFRMLNPANDTDLIEGSAVTMAWNFLWTHELTTTMDRRLGSQSIFPVGIWFMQLATPTTLTGKLMVGWLQNTWSIHNRSGGRGTLATRSYAWRTDTLYSTNILPVLIKWDGLTRY
jgi:hypothetical protein